MASVWVISMALVEGLDFQLVNVDYDQRNADLLRDTFDTDACKGKHEALWGFLGTVIDEGARDDGLRLDVEMCFRTAEEFLQAHVPSTIPPLYAMMFDASTGFLCQAKAVRGLAGLWKARFPIPAAAGRRLPADDPVLMAYRAFLEAKKSHEHDDYEISLWSLDKVSDPEWRS